jgi:hypothetical protein
VTQRLVRTLWPAALAAMLPIVLIATDRPHLESGPPSGAITIDGRHDDWSGALTSLGSNPFSVQVANDNDALYLRLTASDPVVRTQILRQGLIVWFDEGGGTKKRLGIQYPVVEYGSGGNTGQGGGGRGYGGGGHRAGGTSDTPNDDYEPPSRVDILGPGKNDARSLTLDHASGVEVALRLSEGMVLYELKVPLAKTADHPYAIEAAAGKTIGLGFESPKIERQSSGSPAGGYGGGGHGGHGGGMGGRGGGGMGGRGMGGGGNRDFQPPKPLNAWATVMLSQSPAR